MYVEFVKDYGNHKSGDVLDIEPAYAEIVVGGGYANPTDKPEQKDTAQSKPKSKKK